MVTNDLSKSWFSNGRAADPESFNYLIRPQQLGSVSLSGNGGGSSFRPRTTPQDANPVIAFYVFDTVKISRAETDCIGDYAETELLGALYETVKRVGEWRGIQLPAGILGCHGDLIDWSISSSAPARQTLRSWLWSGSFGIDASRLDSEFESALRSTGPLETTPFMIGLVGLKDFAFVEAERRLRNSTIGYLGYFTLQGVPLREAADALSLVIEPKICGNAASGWAVTPENLRRLRLREIPEEDGISADLAYLFPGLAGDEDCIPSARQSFRGTASRVTSWRRLRGKRTTYPNFVNHADLRAFTRWLNNGVNWNSSATPTPNPRSRRVEFVSQAAHFGDN